MAFFFFLWTDDIVEHLAQHGVEPAEFQEVICNPIDVGISRTSGHPRVFGLTDDGRRLVCIYEHFDADTVIPITAWEPEQE